MCISLRLLTEIYKKGSSSNSSHSRVVVAGVFVVIFVVALRLVTVKCYL